VRRQYAESAEERNSRPTGVRGLGPPQGHTVAGASAHRRKHIPVNLVTVGRFGGELGVKVALPVY